MWRNKLTNEDTQILGVTVQNFIVGATWRPSVMHPCLRLLFQLLRTEH